MRRLFSTFARGWPGAGLLLLRLVAGLALIIHGIERFRTGQPIEPVILDIVAIGAGGLLVVGLWTPIAGSLVVVLAVWGTITQSNNPCPCILLGSIGAALTLLGPGAWSLDSRFFGWKRIDLER